MEDRFKAFTTLTSGIGRSISKLKAEVMDRFHLKRSHVSCIYFIYREGSVTASRLVSLSGEDKANISRALKSLEQDGYIEREARTSPHQRVRVKLTARGAEIGEFLVDKVDEIAELASAGVTAEDLSAMYRALGIIEKNLAKLADSYVTEPM